MSDITDDVRELAGIVQTLAATLPSSTLSPVSTSNININAGGVGVWIATTACAVMLAINMFMVALYLDQQQQIRDLDAYLSAIYMMAPSLKPPEKKS